MTKANRSTQSDDVSARAAARLFRFDCPDSMELGEYHLGMVGEPRRGWLVNHLATCPLCKTELAGLRAFMAQPDTVENPRPAERQSPQPGLLERLQWLIADLLPPPTPGFAFAMRGAEETMRSYHAGEYDISLEVAADAAHAGRHQITGLILGAVDTAITVGLALPGQMEVLNTVPLDDAGNFALSDIGPGIYDLLVLPSDNTPAVRIPALDVAS